MIDIIAFYLYCNRGNNSYLNLEWVTHTENNAYSMKLGRLQRCSVTGKLISGL